MFKREEGEDDRPARPVDWIAAMAAVMAPVGIVVSLLSDIGYGAATYGKLVGLRESSSQVLGLCMLLGLFCYIFDITRCGLPKFVKVVIGTALLYAFLAAMVSMSFKYPSSPIIISLAHVPFLLGCCRKRLSWGVGVKQYYELVFGVCVAVCLATLSLWASWVGMEFFGGTNMWVEETQVVLGAKLADVYGTHDVNYTLCNYRSWDALDLDTRIERLSDCKNGNLTLYLTWGSPLVASLSIGVCAIFCRLRILYIPDATAEGEARVERAKSAVQMVVMLFALLVMTLWLSASIAGASMSLSDTILGFSFAIFTVVILWAALTLDFSALGGDRSRVVKNIRSVSSQSWFLGAMIIPVFFPLLMFFALSSITQMARLCTGRAQGHTRWMTPVGSAVWDSLARRNWGKVLPWVCRWALLYFVMSVGVAKLTFIFLSWLNGELEELSFGLVAVVFFLVGFSMFLIPVVPGIPVYVTGGIMLGARGQSEPSLGFGFGVAMGVLCSYALKLAAVWTQQVVIGGMLGSHVTVRRFVGVDKVAVRAMEQILLEPGLTRAKVGILCGGPDWPTSVMTGILGLSPSQMLLGTTPCIILVVPCVLSGAFMLKQAEGGAWVPLIGVMAMVASFSQASAGLYAFYSFQKVANENYDALAAPRPEHRDVEELAAKMKVQEQTYDDVTEWEHIPLLPKLILAISAGVMMASCFLSAMAGSMCWRPFDLGPASESTSKSKVEDPIELGGLDGSALNIVQPLGWVLVAMFTVGSVTWWLFNVWAGRATHRRLKEIQPGVAA
mmetsp:Transcript_56348/g.123455  ORF Transcript_56348/g.123455 Transcript_56348/m.123455 type:complete len:784 (+) Transcript_56348:206-2557(+)